MRTDLHSSHAETAAGAIAEGVLRACVHCGMCNATCPTYQITGDELDGPRGRIYLIKQALEGEAVGRLTQVHLDRCLACRACETTCPSGVEYHRLFDVGREVVAAKVRRPWFERLSRSLIRWLCLERGPRRVLAALARAATLWPAKGTSGSAPDRVHATRMALLGGCVQAAAAPHFNAVTRRVFDKIGITLAETPGAGCCGALSFHLDAFDEARTLARRNIDAWIADIDAGAGAGAIIVNASGCAAFIRDYPDILADDPAYAQKARRVADLVRDPVEILGEAALSAARPPAHPSIAVHDPCTLRNGPRLEGAVARLLAGLGYDPQTVKDSHLCCGSAGAYSLLQPRFARRLRADKIAALTASAPDAICTANIGCWLHLAAKSPVPVRHWIEAVDEVI
jgi:glycolate oxidase iron-sulfur subunit